MKIGAHLSIVVVIILGCVGGLTDCKLVPPRTTPRDELVDVPILINPETTIEASHSPIDAACPGDTRAERQALLDSFRAALSSAGFAIVNGERTPHESVASVSLTCRGNSDGSTLTQATVVLEPGGSASSATVYGAVSQLVARAEVLALGRKWTQTPRRPTDSGTEKATDRRTVSRSAPAAGAQSNDSFVSASPQASAFAVVLGIEQNFSLPPLLGASKDARNFAEWSRQALGLPAEHIKVVLNKEATKGTILRLLAWVSESVPPDGRIYFYFRGQGTSRSTDGAQYILPSDGDPAFLDQTAIPLSDVLDQLSKSRARDVLAVVDSSFSGAGDRSVTAPGAGPIGRVKELTATGRLAVFTAASGAELSGPAMDGSSAFSKYLVMALGTGAADIDGDGQISLQELREWVGARVVREARRDHRDQNPSLVISPDLGAASAFVVEWGLPIK